MTVLADNKVVALGRMLFVARQGMSREHVLVEASGPYAMTENEECFIIQNKDCCKPIVVSVKTKEYK